jgi:D-alanine--poly(phosphoribitol) ligase subunit 1
MGDLRDQGLPSPCSYPVLPAWDPENPIVYVIFTSGSTGGPKGVQISRRALASFVEWIENDFTWHSQDVFLNQAAFSFDLSVYEIMALLRLGGSLVLTGMELARDSRKLIQHLETQACTVWVSTPSFASVMLADRQFSEATLPKLRQFVFCGERLPVALVKELHRRFPRAQVLNTYGPTEATVATTMVEITPEMTELYAQALPVGYPKRNSRIEIHPHPDSSNAIEGEIVIIGDHVASGYFAQPELNAQKFFQIPQAGRETSAFRTGDIGFMRDGLLFFIGRRDHQIKFHGYRIDLAEVDEEILKVDGVSEALTLPLERDGKVMKLLSFVSLRPSMGDLALTPESLRGWLQKKLPAYMVPSEIRFLDALPHNQNHKIDRQKLLELALMKDVRRSA